MGSTFAGKNACNPKNHERPFIIEWDATDASSFQARTATDVVFVRYEGCDLHVIDTCTNEAVKGSFGAYLPADWTSGSLEKMDIGNEGELYAKLPLAAGSLGGRVQAGEKFHMEYYVSGTRHATRPYVYKGEIDKIPGCRGATHVVYAYNLGAFALASSTKVHAEAGGTVWGIGAGGHSTSERAAEKRGGELASCTGESAKELDTCKAPIRLTLREIQEGDNPDATAAVAPETPDALNLAGKLQATNDRERKAGDILTAANAKLTAGDAAGCLRDLDEHDRLDSRPQALSTNPKGYTVNLRVRCLMSNAHCDAGRSLARKMIEATSSPGTAPESIDRSVENIWVTMYCTGSDAQPRDQLMHTMFALRLTDQRPDAGACRKMFDTVKRVGPTIKKDDPNEQLRNVWGPSRDAIPRCFARAGDCTSAWTSAKELAELQSRVGSSTVTDEMTRNDFTSQTKDQCLGKAQGALSPREELLRSIADLRVKREPAANTATCRASYDKARPLVLMSPNTSVENQSSASRLRDAATSCFSEAGDCASTFVVARELARWRDKEVTDRAVRQELDGLSSARACRYKPQGAMTPREKIFFLDASLQHNDAADRAACMANHRELVQLLGPAPAPGTPPPPSTDRNARDVESIRDRETDHAVTCLVNAHACDDAKVMFRAAARARALAQKSTRPVDDAKLDQSFALQNRKCATTP
ncbi:MAG: hypothetical protein JWM74_4773 [Myxococcaceae bacterium]|nr:hypothetical protein [Myxococcaceae bacterium]